MNILGHSLKGFDALELDHKYSLCVSYRVYSVYWWIKINNSGICNVYVDCTVENNTVRKKVTYFV